MRNEQSSIHRMQQTTRCSCMSTCQTSLSLSLDKSLFCTKQSKAPILEWRSRFQIAINTTKALAYLHEGISNQCIIHSDVKPENIFLDSNVSAKVGDFGMSRTMNREKTQTMTINVRGTRGYVAPEWLSNHQITIKSDVYSFSMVLLEIVGGQRNLKDSNLLGVEPDPGRCLSRMGIF